jgi:HD-GYP domain-containing protein (c-di-GMP phosphodiesterase class II)
VALADVYDALTSHRVYRPAVSHAEAREWIVSNYGSQFDPDVVEAFVAREHDFAKVSQTMTPPRAATEQLPALPMPAEVNSTAGFDAAAAPA